MKVLIIRPFFRLFLVDFNDRKICALLDKDIKLDLYDVVDFKAVEDVEVEKAVMTYLQIQRSLFDDSDITKAFSYHTLLLDDMSYIDFFLKTVSNEINIKNTLFKDKTKADDVTKYLKNFNRFLNAFYNNFSRYYYNQEINIKATVYEEAQDKIPAKGYEFISSELMSCHSQIELLSLLMLYGNYQNEIFRQIGISFFDSPWKSYFTENPLENAMFLQMNLDFLKYAANMIDEDLNKLNQVVAKSYGKIDINLLKELLLKNTVFEIICLEVLENLRTNATEKAKSDFLHILINKKLEYQNVNDYMDMVINDLKMNVICSVSILSFQEQAYDLFTVLNDTNRQMMTSVKDGLIKESYDTIELIKPLEIEQSDVHFAVVDTTVNLSTDQSERFTKVYPVFPAETTKGTPIILLDFFNTAANHLTRTILRALRVIILNGFSLQQLETELAAENVTIEITQFLRMEPYHEFYRMIPTGEKRLITQIKNANIGYLALDDLFAGNIPKVILNEIEKLPSTEEYNLARYPVESYTKGETVSSKLQRKEKAIIFVHGKQNIPYFNGNSDVLPQIDSVWRNKGRMDVWNGFYEYVNKNPEDFDNYDFYEYIYDTSVLDASEYGKVLSEILFENSIHTAYDEIYMIASSMGGLVSRYCLNHEYRSEEKGSPVFFGDYIKELITLDTPHLGTIAQNFILSVNPSLMEAVLEVKTDNPPNIDLTLGTFITSFINGTEAEKSAELMIYFARNHPEMVGKLFTEMLRFLDPFPGGMCMLYSPEDYCESLGIYLYSETKNLDFEGVFVSEPPTNQLNADDAYLDKLYLCSAELTEQSNDITQGLSITYYLMEIIGEKLSHQTMDNLSRHGRNDGVVNLYSQQMWGIDKGQQRHHFMDLDHLAVPRSMDVVTFIMKERVLK